MDIDRRNGGCGVVFEGKFYLWGGQTADKVSLGDDSDSEEADSDDEIEIAVDLPRKDVDPKKRPNLANHPFDVLDTATCEWSRQPTGGTPPLLGLGSSLVVHQPTSSFFLYGGWNDRRFSGDVYRISTESWDWEVLEPSVSSGVVPSPRYRTCVIMHGSAVCVFGGVGPDIVKGSNSDNAKGAEYHEYRRNDVPSGFGWNNEYYEFDFEKSKKPSCSGL